MVIIPGYTLIPESTLFYKRLGRRALWQRSLVIIVVIMFSAFIVNLFPLSFYTTYSIRSFTFVLFFTVSVFFLWFILNDLVGRLLTGFVMKSKSEMEEYTGIRHLFINVLVESVRMTGLNKEYYVERNFRGFGRVIIRSLLISLFLTAIVAVMILIGAFVTNIFS